MVDHKLSGNVFQIGKRLNECVTERKRDKWTETTNLYSKVCLTFASQQFTSTELGLGGGKSVNKR